MSVLMTYIILFSSDSVQLENKKMIEKIQVKIKIFWTKISLIHFVFNDFFPSQYNYLKLMEVYVYANHPRVEARACLASVLGVLSCVREMADIKKARSINQSACSQSAQYKV